MKTIYFFLLLLTSGLSFAQTSDKPLYEIGLFGGAAFLPDYPASDQSHWRYIALPFALYRGKTLRIDEQDGARARLFQKPLFEFNLSMAASFPAESDRNTTREGMPDLDWLGEVGPSLTINLFYQKKLGELQLWIPFRAVFSSDFKSLQNRGHVLSPFFLYRRHNLFTEDDTFFMSFITRFGTEKINDYFYEVQPEYSRDGRSTFDAQPGYIGNTFFMGQSLRFHKKLDFFLGGFIDSHHLAKNRYSPLFKRKENFGAIFGLGWRFFKSKNKGHK